MADADRRGMPPNDRTAAEWPPPGYVEGHPFVDHLKELYAAACVYTPQRRGGEALLRSVIPGLDGIGGHHRLTAHRHLYQAAHVADTRRTTPVVIRGSELYRQLMVLPLPGRAALFLVDAADMRYADAAYVLDTNICEFAALVSSSRRVLVEACCRSHCVEGPGRR
jgi:hypothetical protein